MCENNPSKFVASTGNNVSSFVRTTNFTSSQKAFRNEDGKI